MILFSLQSQKKKYMKWRLKRVSPQAKKWISWTKTTRCSVHFYFQWNYCWWSITIWILIFGRRLQSAWPEYYVLIEKLLSVCHMSYKQAEVAAQATANDLFNRKHFEKQKSYNDEFPINANNSNFFETMSLNLLDEVSCNILQRILTFCIHLIVLV